MIGINRKDIQAILKAGAKKFQKISTHLLIMEVDFCPALCIAEMPILRAF